MNEAMLIVGAIAVFGAGFLTGMFYHWRWLPPKIRRDIETWQDDTRPRMIVSNYTPPGGRSSVELARERIDRWYR